MSPRQITSASTSAPMAAQAVGRTKWDFPGADVATAGRWLGGVPPRFDELVARLCAELLHKESSKKLLKACCTAVDVKPYDPVDKDSDLVKWRFPQLLTTILDSPDHLSR